MWRLKEKDKIQSRQLASIEHAYYTCRPEKYRGAFAAAFEDLSVVQQFIRHLFSLLKDESKLEQIWDAFQKLPFEEEGSFI
mmetsp:Transcript_15894/g.24494  ORF Transcript_15894/g.24494 Transcript_15894/m.24494 type:complete len:81 (+) Transcript_15894:1926-2168(+)